MKFELGVELKDIVTGFTGYALGRTEYLTGCIHYGLCPKKPGPGSKINDWEWFDESRLKETGRAIAGYKVPRTSGPEPNAPSN